MDGKCFAQLGQHRHLEHLSLSLFEYEPEEVFSPHKVAFGQYFNALHTLSIHAGSYIAPIHVATLCSVLRGITSPHLTVLDVRPMAFIPAHQVEEIVCAISRHHTLAELTIRQNRSSDTDNHTLISNQVMIHHLRPLIRLDRIYSLALQFIQPVNLDDGHLEEFALAWPNLERFQLISYCPLPDAPRVTLKGLVPFARFCPELSSLCLTLTAKHGLEELTPPESTECNLESLVLYHSPLDPLRARSIATFLRAIFPNLWNISSHGGVSFEPDGWATVKRCITDLEREELEQGRGLMYSYDQWYEELDESL